MMFLSLHKTFVMDKIRNIYQEGRPLAEEYDTLIPDKIEVLDCVTHTDCTYTETVRFSFFIGNERGASPVQALVSLLNLTLMLVIVGLKK